MFAVLHQLTSDVVNRSDVISVYGVAESKGVSQKGSAEKQRLALESKNGPDPGSQVCENQERV